MALATSLTSNQTTTEGFITVIDGSTYSSPTIREDYGIALIVKTDPGSGTYTEDTSLNDITNPGITGTAGTWDIAFPNSRVNYEIIAYWCPVWIAGTYTLNTVVFLVDTFYYCNVASSTEEPGTGTEWTVIGTGAIATIFATDTTLSSETIYESVFPHVDYETVLIECDDSFKLIDHTTTGYYKRYLITGYDIAIGDDIDTMVTNDSTLVPVYYNGLTTGTIADITIPSDGVFIITIEENATSSDFTTGTNSVVAQFPLYSYCKLKTCYNYLVQSVMCNNWDPCCDNCDEEAKQKKIRQRQSLNQIVALYPLLLAYINEEFISYLGFIEYDQTRYDYAEQIDMLMDKINDILERCELCQGAWQTTTTSTTNTSGSFKPCNC
jgi:hypothetical protein